MKTLTESQIERLDAALAEVDKASDEYGLCIPDEVALAAIIDVFHTAVRLLKAGETIRVSIANQAGVTVAWAPIALENV